MLVSFSVSNWKSIREETGFSMVAGRETRFRDRLPYLEKLDIKLIPVTAIYGANASGKSVLISALQFAQSFILYGTEPDADIDIRPFLLDNESADQPSSFRFVFSVSDIVYEYSFSLSKTKVLSEQLNRVLKTRTQLIFEKKFNDGNSTIKLGKVSKEHHSTLSFIGSRTSRDNQLYLTSTVYQNSDYFKDIYNWFRNSIVIITPEARYIPILDLVKPENKMLYSYMLEYLDTGIVELSLKEEKLSADMEEKLRRRYKDELKSGKPLMLNYGTKRRQVIELSQDRIRAKTLVPRHQTIGERMVDFSFAMESDGTNRLLDIMPAFMLLLTASDITVLIDELDRSLHSKLSKTLIELYLNTCSEAKRSQLIFTTHDVMLMDQNLLRRDELCVMERSSQGTSSVISLSEYKEIRSDLDIRKSYLNGHLGGIPNILLNELCSLAGNKDETNE